MMPSIDKLPLFWDDVRKLPEQIQQMVDSTSNCDKIYFLYRYALEHAHRLNLELNHLVTNISQRIECNINNNYDQLLTTINNYEEKGIDYLNIRNMLKARIFVNKPH